MLGTMRATDSARVLVIQPDNMPQARISTATDAAPDCGKAEFHSFSLGFVVSSNGIRLTRMPSHARRDAEMQT